MTLCTSIHFEMMDVIRSECKMQNQGKIQYEDKQFVRRSSKLNDVLCPV